MKSYTKIIITLVLSLINTHAFGDIISDLNSIKKQLQDAANQIPPAAQQLKNTQQQLTNDVINQLNNAINDINKQGNGIKDVISQVAGIPGIVKNILAIGDLQTVLEFIRDKPLGSILGTLEPIKKSFQEVIDQFNADKDPKGIYKDFNTASANFTAAIKEIDNVIEALKEL